jgi:hypothetical protein
MNERRLMTETSTRHETSLGFGIGEITYLIRLTDSPAQMEGWVTARAEGDAVEASAPLHDEELEERIENFRQESPA